MKLNRETVRTIVAVIGVIMGIVLIIAGTDIRVLKNPISSTTTAIYNLQGHDEMELGNLHYGEVVRCVMNVTIYPAQ